MPATPFVGREEELRALRAAVADQEGKVVLVIGGEGRGKSALLAELNRQLAQEPFYFPLLYQLNDKDMSDAFLGRLMDDLLNIGGLTKGKLIPGAPDQAQRWRDLLDTTTGFGEVPHHRPAVPARLQHRRPAQAVGPRRSRWRIGTRGRRLVPGVCR